jgi:hypothetical protein
MKLPLILQRQAKMADSNLQLQMDKKTLLVCHNILQPTIHTL